MLLATFYATSGLIPLSTASIRTSLGADLEERFFQTHPIIYHFPTGTLLNSWAWRGHFSGTLSHLRRGQGQTLRLIYAQKLRDFNRAYCLDPPIWENVTLFIFPPTCCHYRVFLKACGAITKSSYLNDTGLLAMTSVKGTKQ